MPPRVLFRQDQLAFACLPFRISYSNVLSIFRFCALESNTRTWAVGGFMATKRPQTLTETFAKSTVVSESFKIIDNFQLAYLSWPRKWVNGMTYIGATPALHLGAE